MQILPVDSTSQPIKNWATDPAFYNDNVNGATDGAFILLGGGATYTRALSTTDVPAGMYRARVDTLTSTGNYGRRWSFVWSVPLNVGDVIRISYWNKASFAAKANPYLEFSTAINGYAGAISSGQVQTLTAGVWTRFTYTYTVANSNYKYLRTVGNYSSATPDGAIGDQIWHSGLIVTINQPLPEVFCDGNTPGWKWLGTAGNSLSVGWPYMLESVTGKPMTDLTGNDVIGTISGNAFDPFTVYHVYDATAPAAVWTTLWTVYGSDGVAGWATTGGMSYGRRNGLADNSYSHSRFGTGAANNQSAVGTSATAPRRGFTQGRHIAAQTVTFGVSVASCTTMIDGLADDTIGNLSKGTGIGRTGLKVRSGAASTEGPDGLAQATPIRTLYFPGDHSRSMRVAVAKWLGNKYGVPIP
ncbi:MAG: hypothetical protein V4611_04780 [Patescibacteria group bacterium]